MSLTKFELRELVALAAVRNTSPAAYARIEQLTGGLKIGDLAHQSQFEDVFLVQFTPEQTVERFIRLDPYGASRSAEEVMARTPEAHFEVWGATWAWHESLHRESCLTTKNRPQGDRWKTELVNAIEAFRANREGFEPNAFQRIAAEEYGEGDYAYLNEIKGERAYRAALEDIGDTLFQFAIIELGTAEGADSPGEASGRMYSAGEELQTLAQSLHALDDEPKTVPAP